MATTLTIRASQSAALVAWERRFRVRRSRWIALVLSIVIHAAWSLWPVEPPKSADDVVLSATLTEMPAPPAAAPAPSPSKRKAKPKRVVPVAPLEAIKPETSASLSGDVLAPELVPDRALAPERSLAEISPDALAPITS